MYSCAQCHREITPQRVLGLDQFSVMSLAHRCDHWWDRLCRRLRRAKVNYQY